MTKPTMIPFAIDVTDQIPVDGKPWRGGLGNSKLVLHTIEAADPWDIGWPRTWSRWKSAPHLAMNSDRFPDGDWLYQTLPFDVAAYAIRDNSLEDDAYTYQMEMAGQAKNVPTYPNSFYEAIATVADWFVTEMDVPNEWMDFSCAQYGVDSPCRRTQTEVDFFAGFMGHCHVGYGVDSHSDPGKLDTERVQSYMKEAEMPQQQWHQMIDALFLGRPDMFKPPAPVGPDYWKNLDPDSAEWKDFWNAFVKAISNT